MDSLLRTIDPKYLSHTWNNQPKFRPNPKKKPFLQQNLPQQPQLLIPSTNKQNSSYFHLHEQIRLLKKKNHHFQSHMNHMKLQYQQLILNLEEIDQNQKQSIRKSLELTQKYSTANSKIQECENQIHSLNYINAQLKKQLEIQKQNHYQIINRYKNQESILYARNHSLQQQIKMINFGTSHQQKPFLKQLLPKLQQTQQTLNDDTHKLTQYIAVISELTTFLKNNNDKLHQLELEYFDLRNRKNNYEQQLTAQMTQINKLREEIERLNYQNHILKSQINDISSRQQQPNNQQNNKTTLNIIRTVSFTLSTTFQLPTNNNQLNSSTSLLQKKQQQLTNLSQQLKLLQQKSIIEQKQKIQYINKLQNQVNYQNKQLQKLTLESTNIQKQHHLQQVQPSDKQEAIPFQQTDESKPLSELQTQYHNQLQKLRGLVLSHRNQHKPTEQLQPKFAIKLQNKFDIPADNYQIFHNSLIIDPTTNTPLPEQHMILLQTIHKWQTAYQNLQKIYQTKLVSKQEQIHLLSLKLIDLN